MRKLILEIELNEMTREGMKPTFTHIHSYEVLEVLKMDYDEGVYIDLIECVLKEHASIDDLDYIGNMEILNILKSEGNRYTLLVKGHESEDSAGAFKEADFNLIYTTPSFLSEDRIVISFIGAQKDLAKFVDMTRTHIGTITNLTVRKAAYQKKDIISALTDKQREIMAAAYEHGYYDIPRRIASRHLAEKVGLSKPTLMEHLRKAEKRLVAEVMAGQS